MSRRWSRAFKTPHPPALTIKPPDAASTLRRTVFGFRQTQLVGVVAELGVADALRGGARSAADLAAAVGADARSLHRVLRAPQNDTHDRLSARSTDCCSKRWR